jgi:hypothetical protein
MYSAEKNMLKRDWHKLNCLRLLVDHTFETGVVHIQGTGSIYLGCITRSPREDFNFL